MNLNWILNASKLYSRLTLVVTFWEASHISLKKTFSSFLSLYIVSYTPRGFPICEKKFHRFSFKNLWTSKWKIYFLPQKVVTHFFDFIGFMVVKTTGSTSGLTSFLRFWKHCTIARNICDSLCYFFIRFANFSGYTALFQNRKKLVIPEVQLVVLHTIIPMNSTKWVTTFSWIFHFSFIDF